MFVESGIYLQKMESICGKWNVFLLEVECIVGCGMHSSKRNAFCRGKAVGRLLNITGLFGRM